MKFTPGNKERNSRNLKDVGRNGRLEILLKDRRSDFSKKIGNVFLKKAKAERNQKNLGRDCRRGEQHFCFEKYITAREYRRKRPVDTDGRFRKEAVFPPPGMRNAQKKKKKKNSLTRRTFLGKMLRKNQRDLTQKNQVLT